MARLQKELSDQRKAFMLDLFKSNPGLSVNAANEQLKAKFGAMMRPQLAYEIKKQATGAAPAKEVTKAERKPAKVVSIRSAKPKQAKRKELTRAGRNPETVGEAVKNVVLTAPPQLTQNKVTVLDANGPQYEGVRALVASLNAAGLTDLQCEHVMGKYAVVAPRSRA